MRENKIFLYLLVGTLLLFLLSSGVSSIFSGGEVRPVGSFGRSPIGGPEVVRFLRGLSNCRIQKIVKFDKKYADAVFFTFFK